MILATLGPLRSAEVFFEIIKYEFKNSFCSFDRIRIYISLFDRMPSVVET